MDLDQKYNLITRNLQEIIGTEPEIKNILEIRPLKLYWGTAPTSRIHIGYFVPLLKIADYIKAGCEITILLADLHAYLDNIKSNLELIESRTKYYQIIITEILKYLDINAGKIKFVIGSEYQLEPKYTKDIYKLNSMVRLSEAKHAASEVVKLSDNPTINSLIYPALQALDEEYLQADGESGGLDQRHIFTFSRTYMPQLNYKKRFYFLNKMVPNLRFKKQESKPELSDNFPELKSNLINTIKQADSKTNLITSLQDKINNLLYIPIDKMSSSNPETKIDFLDTKIQIKSKINKTYCYPGDIEDNSLLSILEYIIFPILEIKNKKFIINRPEKYGGPIIYENSQQIKLDFQNNNLHPSDLKLGIIDNLDFIIDPIRNKFEEPELQNLLNSAYPKLN